MKKYSEPALDVLKMDIEDYTNTGTGSLVGSPVITQDPNTGDFRITRIGDDSGYDNRGLF